MITGLRYKVSFSFHVKHKPIPTAMSWNCEISKEPSNLWLFNSTELAARFGQSVTPLLSNVIPSSDHRLGFAMDEPGFSPRMSHPKKAGNRLRVTCAFPFDNLDWGTCRVRYVCSFKGQQAKVLMKGNDEIPTTIMSQDRRLLSLNLAKGRHLGAWKGSARGP